MTFFRVKTVPTSYLEVQFKVRTKALSLVWMDDEHQSLVQHMLSLQSEGINCRQFSELLNASGATSWTGKKFYPELILKKLLFQLFPYVWSLLEKSIQNLG